MVPPIPLKLSFDVLTSDEVHLRSYGRVRTAGSCASPPTPMSGGLDDPAIFGPLQDMCCSCGELIGGEPGDVCPSCGVVLGHAEMLQKTRWGHIDLPIPVEHVLIPIRSIRALPVLPLAYRQHMTCGPDLDHFYSKLVAACDACSAACQDAIKLALAQLFCNEKLPEPAKSHGRVLRSISHYLFESWARTDVDVGVYLRALCLKLTPETG